MQTILVFCLKNVGHYYIIYNNSYFQALGFHESIMINRLMYFSYIFVGFH